MPFSANASIISTDMDNMLRGLYRDNSDTAVTGTLVETTLKSVSIAANSIGPTGGLHIVVVGSIAGAAGTKTMRIKYAGSTLGTIPWAAGVTGFWFFETWLYNTSNTAQRIFNRNSDATGTTILVGYSTAAVDTTQNQLITITGQLGNVADTITATMFDIYVAQIQ